VSLALMWLCIETAPHIPREWGGSSGREAWSISWRPCLSRPSIFGARRGLQVILIARRTVCHMLPAVVTFEGADIGGAFGKVGQAIPIQTAIAIRFG